MIVAVDTNILVRAFRELEQDHLEALVAVRKHGKLCQDHGQVIITEYEQNVGRLQGFRKWYQRLQQSQAIHFCSGKLPRSHRASLAALGCHECTDHAFIGAAFNSGKMLVSEDSDVGKGPRGGEFPHCEALQYLTATMGLSVHDAVEFCAYVDSATVQAHAR